MRPRLGHVAALALVWAVGCWKTKPNPDYCTGDEQCTTPGMTRCDLVSHECAPAEPDLGIDLAMPDLTPMCSEMSSCADPMRPYCDPSGICQKCTAMFCAGTALPVCATSGACVECTSNDDCAAAGKSCNTTTNTCGPCNVNSDCTTGACRADRQCAKVSDGIVYLNNSGTPACSDGGMGTMAAPFCTTAVAMASTAKNIVVVASPTTYDAISMTVAGDKSIIGPGVTVTNAPTFTTGGQNALKIALTSGSGAVQATGIILAGNLAASAVSCSQSTATAALTIAKSKISGSTPQGIDISNCTFTLDASEVSGNNGGGIVMSGTTYTITNNMIVGNGSLTTSLPGVTFGAGSTGTFAFNTVAANSVSVASGIGGGLDCGATMKTIVASIVADNTLHSNTQMNGNCVFSKVVGGSAETNANTNNVEPTFVGASNFRLTDVATNHSCCFDQISTDPGNNHDIDGTHRPQHGAWDIGAYELP